VAEDRERILRSPNRVPLRVPVLAFLTFLTFLPIRQINNLPTSSEGIRTVVIRHHPTSLLPYQWVAASGSFVYPLPYFVSRRFQFFICAPWQHGLSSGHFHAKHTYAADAGGSQLFRTSASSCSCSAKTQGA